MPPRVGTSSIRRFADGRGSAPGIPVEDDAPTATYGAGMARTSIDGDARGALGRARRAGHSEGGESTLTLRALSVVLRSTANGRSEVIL